MTIKFSTQKSTVLPRIPATITDAATRAFLEDVLKHLDRLNRDVRGDFDKIVAGDAALDHGLMFGLADDDHTQYFNTTRGDARFSQLGHDHASAYAALSHAHDDRYYTESESDLRYSLLGHNHDLTYAAIAHNHDLLYAALGHNHDSDYSAIGHDHDSDYPAIVGTSVDNHFVSFDGVAGQQQDSGYGVVDFALAGHNHNGLYYSIPEYSMYNLLANTTYGASISDVWVSSLRENRIAMITKESSTYYLSCMERSGGVWSLVGSKLSLGTSDTHSICSLNETDVVVSEIGTYTIKYFRFDESTWSQVGNTYSGSGITVGRVCGIDGSNFAILTSDGPQLYYATFNGTDFSLVGNALTGIGSRFCSYSISESDEPQVVCFRSDTGEIKIYTFDGTDWTGGYGTDISHSDYYISMTKLSDIEIAICFKASGDVKVYRYKDKEWLLVSDTINVGVDATQKDTEITSSCNFDIVSVNGYNNADANAIKLFKFCLISDEEISYTDIVAGDVSITKHGFAPKAPNDNTLYLDGLGGYSFPKTKEVPITISNSTGDAVNDITFSAGWIYDSTGAVKLVLASPMTKQSDAAYAVGTGAGGGNLSGSGWFHCYVIRKDSDGTIGCCFNTVPAGHTYYRHVGWIYHTDAAGITEFFQEGNRFRLKTLIQNCATENPGTNAVLQAVTCPPEMLAIVNVSGYNATTTTNSTCIVTSPSETDSAPSDTFFTFANRGGASRFGSAEVVRKTDSSSRIRYRVSYSASTITVYVNSIGWIDTLLK